MSKFLFLIILMTSYSIHSAEMIVGEEKMEPGIDLIFEAAPKDIVHPKESVSYTHLTLPTIYSV